MGIRNLYAIRANRQVYEDLIREGYVVDRIDPIIAPAIGYYYDSKTGECAPITDSMYNIWFGGTQNEFNQWNNDHDAFSLADDEEYTLPNVLDFYNTIRVSSGVITEFSFSRQIADFSFELTNSYVRNAKASYLNALEDFENARSDASTDPSDLENLRNTVKVEYAEFLRELDAAIADYKEANGIV